MLVQLNHLEGTPVDQDPVVPTMPWFAPQHAYFDFVGYFSAKRDDPDYWDNAGDYARYQEAGGDPDTFTPSDKPPVLSNDHAAFPVNRYLGAVHLVCKSDDFEGVGELVLNVKPDDVTGGDESDPRIRFWCDLAYKYNPFGFGDFSVAASADLEIDQFGEIGVLDCGISHGEDIAEWTTAGYGALALVINIG